MVSDIGVSQDSGRILEAPLFENGICCDFSDSVITSLMIPVVLVSCRRPLEKFLLCLHLESDSLVRELDDAVTTLLTFLFLLLILLLLIIILLSCSRSGASHCSRGLLFSQVIVADET